MQLGFDDPWLLLALPLALLPLLRLPLPSVAHPNLRLIPQDPPSRLLETVCRLAAVAGIVSLVLGFAGLSRGERSIERVGTGAEVVILLDRSRSMDHTFGRNTNNEQMVLTRGESKTTAARRVLDAFIASRPGDAIGLLLFSTKPINALPLTTRHEALQAAVSAAGLGRGLAETDIGLALYEGLRFFDDRPYNGSRVLMLVSDGGAQLDAVTRETLTRLAREYRVSLYWIYMRGRGSPGLDEPLEEGSLAQQDAVPELFLNRFFSEMGIPYQAYEAEDPEQLQAAINDIDRLQRLPTRTAEVEPPQPLSAWTFGSALVLLLPVLLVSALQVTRWYKSAAPSSP